jgi:hypothetical protein
VAACGAWNGKIQNLGGGGLVGSVGSTTSATSDGYVGSSTDGGHTTAQNGARGTFGVIQATNQLDRGKIIDYIIESIHQQVEWSKLVSLNYYNAKPTRNYWNGCSTGGRQGLALALLRQRVRWLSRRPPAPATNSGSRMPGRG